MRTEDFLRGTGRAEAEWSSEAASEIDPERRAVLARFDKLSTLERAASDRPEWLARCVAVLAPFPIGLAPRRRLAELGLEEWRAFETAGGGLRVAVPSPPALEARSRVADVRASPLSRLVVLDPCLGTGRGHYLGHARALASAAARLSKPIVWGANQALDDRAVPDAVEARRCFRRCFIDLHKAELRQEDLSGDLLEDWLALAEGFEGPGVHWLMHTADAHLIRATSRLLETRPSFRSPIHLVLHVDPRRLAGRTAGEEVHRTIVRLRRSMAWERTLFFWAENRPLAAWLGEWLQAPIPVAPALVDACIAPAARAQDEHLRLTVLGESRASKGFLLLPAIADAIGEDKTLRQSLRLVVQWSPPLTGDLDPHRRALARLRAHPFVEVCEGEMSDETYLRRLRESDGLLFPYDRELYRLRGSGVLVEGLVNGKVLIVLAGSALVDSAADGVVLTFRQPEEIVGVLRRLRDHKADYLAMAARRAARFRGLNGAERFIRAMDRRARGIGEFGVGDNPA